MKVIWCDTGYNTPHTYKHANELIDNLGLNVHLYVPKQTTAHRDATIGIPQIEDPLHVLFTEQVKFGTFQQSNERAQTRCLVYQLKKRTNSF